MVRDNLEKILKFIYLKRVKTLFDHPPWLEKILKLIISNNIKYII